MLATVFDDKLSLRISHSLNIFTFYLVLGHAGDLQDQIWILQVRTNFFHPFYDLVYAVAFQ